MAIWLPRLAIDRWRHSEHCAPGEGADAAPVALIAETAHGFRITAVNDAGRMAAAAPGMMLADARAVCPALAAVPSDPAGDLAFLERLALWAQRWGPWAAVDAPDGLLIDVSAVAHLFGGEAQLLAEVHARFAARDLAARAAIAPTAGAAWALAHHAALGAILTAGDDAEARLGALPMAALRLDADVLLVLRRLGLKRIGDVQGIGRDALRRRFRSRAAGAHPLLRLDQMLGRVAEPLLPVVAAPMPLVQRRLLEPILHRDLLDQVIADLAQDLEHELERRGEGARRLELGFWKVDGDAVFRALELAAATREPAHIARLFAAKLDDVDAGFGIELARLRASWTEPLKPGQVDLEEGEEDRGTSLAVFVDRLTVRLGAEAVRRPVPYASHLPERAQRWQKPLASQPAEPEGGTLSVRPLKLFDRPEPIEVIYTSPDGYPRQFRWRGGLHEVVRVAGPERIAPEWWREKGSARLRDYYRIEDAEGRRYWLYRHGHAHDGRGGPPIWYLQGLYA